MPTFAGENTKQSTFLNVESHKLHIAFPATGAIKPGQPVKLAADGRISPLGAADANYLKLGIAVQEAKSENDEITVVMRPHAVITAVSSGAVSAGPGKWASFNSTLGYHVYVAAADAATSQAFILEDAAGAGELIEVAIF